MASVGVWRFESVCGFGDVGKKKVKYSAIAECEIIHLVNCEILLLRRNVK